MAKRFIDPFIRIYRKELRECPNCGFKLFALTDVGQKCVSCSREFRLTIKMLKRLQEYLREHNIASDA